MINQPLIDEIIELEKQIKAHVHVACELIVSKGDEHEIKRNWKISWELKETHYKKLNELMATNIKGVKYKSIQGAALWIDLNKSNLKNGSKKKYKVYVPKGYKMKTISSLYCTTTRCFPTYFIVTKNNEFQYFCRFDSSNEFEIGSEY